LILRAKALVASGEIDHHLARAASLQAGRDAPLAEQHGFDIGRVGHHQEHHLGLARHFFGVAAGHGRRSGHAGGNLAARVNEERMAGGRQMQRHRRAHDAQADESDVHERSLCCSVVKISRA